MKLNVYPGSGDSTASSTDSACKRLIILVDLGSAFVSEAITSLLTGNGYTCVTHKASTPAPDIIVVDASTLSRYSDSGHPDAKLLLVEMGMETREVVRLLLMYRVNGVIASNTDLRGLRRGLDILSEGRVWIADSTIRSYLDEADLISRRGRILGLTERQREIIDCVRQGYTNKEIAAKLSISPLTVKSHVQNMFRILGTTNRTHLASLAAINRSSHEGER